MHVLANDVTLHAHAAAHPDDEVLGCGGAIARHIFDKDIVEVIILGEGITSRSKIRNVD